MRRLLASVGVLLVVAAVPTTAHAAPTPLDPVPVTMGTFTGQGGCDTGWCGASLDLVGRFALGPGSFQSTAHLAWSGSDATDRWAGTITAPRFAGPCEVRTQSAGVDPVIGTSYGNRVSCDVHLDGGLSTCNLTFAYTTTNVGDSSNDQSGNFFPSWIDRFVTGSC